MTDELSLDNWHRAAQRAIDNLTPGVRATLAADPQRPELLLIHVESPGGSTMPVLLRWPGDDDLFVRVGRRGPVVRKSATRAGLQNAVTFSVLEALIRATVGDGTH